MSEAENIFSAEFDFGPWFTRRVLPWIAIVFLGGVGSIVYGYWSLSMQVQRLKQTSCCGQVQDNKESVNELKRAVSILVKIHTSNGESADGALDTLPDWSRSYYRPPAFKEPRDIGQNNDVPRRCPYDSRYRDIPVYVLKKDDRDQKNDKSKHRRGG